MNKSNDIRSYADILSDDDIEYLLNLPEVLSARKEIDGHSSGSVYFSIKLTPEIKSKVFEKFGLDLPIVPMRWIKGDTLPHLDKGLRLFNKTHLVYLTNSIGELKIEEATYPISKGIGYVFSEGLKHQTIGTGIEPRLLLGPMSEEGFAVGSSFNYPGGTTIYMRDVASNIQYSLDQVSWNNIGNNWPILVNNSNTGLGNVKIKFVTNITLDNSSPGGSSKYFVCLTSNIQIGDESLKSDGTRPIITIDGISGYPGLVENGSPGDLGKNNIYIYNLDVRIINGSTLYADDGGVCGWVGKYYFGRSATNNYIINCSSDGPILNGGGGGIIGSYSANDGGNVNIIGCSSSGSIGTFGGGIIGQFAGYGGSGSVTCTSCWSTGEIGLSGGGIVGDNAANNGTVTISNCYSTGIITPSAGGICGGNPGNNSGTVSISNCYTTGAINIGSGGIVGSNIYGTLNITNCYTTGNVSGTNGGGITGANVYITINFSHCYCSGTVGSGGGYIQGGSGTLPSTCYSEAYYSSSGWNSNNANTALTGYPSSVVGTNWIYTGLNNPYELRTMGYTPYTIANIDLSSSPALKTSFSGTVVIGDTTNPAIISGKSYNKLQITGGTPASYGGIIIDSTTGAISTTSSTVPGVYTIYLRNDGSYNVTTYILTVTSSGPVPCLTEDTLVLTPNGYIPVNKLTNGDKVRTSDKRDVVIQQIFQTIAVGNEKTYPCFIPKNSIGPNYPKEDLKISRDHLIQYKNMWIYPKRYFPLDKTQDIVKYFHIKLPNYMKDNLVINGGTVVESLCYHPSLPFKKKYMDEYKRRKSTWMDNVEIDEKLLTIKGNSKLKDKNKRDKILL